MGSKLRPIHAAACVKRLLAPLLLSVCPWVMPGPVASAVRQELTSRPACSGFWHFLVGVALPDTVPVDLGVAAGYGDVIDPDDPRWGQKFLLERSNPGIDADTIVLVRWSRVVENLNAIYGPLGSAQWIPPGERRLVDVVLRDPTHWASGLPTLDVAYDPFPEPTDRRVREAEARGAL